MSLSVSASGMSNAQFRENIHAHNIANLDTPGFKALQAKTAEAQGGGISVTAVTRNEAAGPLLAPELGATNGTAIEGSNVDLLTERVGQILDVTSFKANASAFHVQDETLKTALDLLG